MNKTKKLTLRAERNMVCALCAFVFLLFAGAALAGWLAAPFPVGAVLTGVAAFVLVFTGILSIGWVKYARRFYAAAKAPHTPPPCWAKTFLLPFMPPTRKKLRRTCAKALRCLPCPPATRGSSGWNARSG